MSAEPHSGGGASAPADYAAGLARVRAALERHAARAAGSSPAAEPLPDIPPGAPGTLATLCHRFGLSSFERDVLLLAAGIELDAAFAPLCAQAQVDPKHDYPTFGLALAALPGGSWEALLPDAPLRRWQLLRLAPGEGLTSARLTIDERILHYLLGLESRDERLAGLVEPVTERGELVPSHRRLAERLAGTWERTRGSDDFPVVELCGEESRSKWAVAAAASERLGWRLHALAAEALPSVPEELERLLRLWHREAILAPVALLLAADDLRPEDPQEAAVRRFADQVRSPLILTRRRRLVPRHRPVLSLDVGKPDLAEQREVWRGVLGDAAGGEFPITGARLEALVDTFDLGAAEIRSACFEALGRAAVEDADGISGASVDRGLWETCRSRVRPALADLAERIEAHLGWDDLVLPEPQRDTLHQIVAHVRRRGTVYRSWGFDRSAARGRGIAVLFGGPSGTGKTLAAEVLSGELALDLFRIDLSSVISKYIGETEKNLQQIFDAAEAGGAILLFDEADALFGKRSDVKDSHDRYANIEVSYLLQRMESYRGLAILTTNLPDALDPAFRRRLRFIVQFPFPDAEQRKELWRRVFPSDAPTETLDLERLARLNVAGGHIRNIALHAAFLAAEEERPVTMGHLRAAAHRELAKVGRSLSEAETRDWVR